MPYGRRVKKEKGRKKEFSFEAHTDVVGEIRLEKNPSDDICNACLKKNSLTYDHVPPQGTGNRESWRYQSYLNYVTSPEFKKQYVQNGLAWKTVCRECHDKIGRFDMEISDIYSKIKAQYKYKGRPYMPVTIRPNAIIRGTLMHFLSAKSFHDHCKTDDLFEQLLDDDQYPIPDDTHFYVFPFLQKQIRVFNGIGFPLSEELIALVHCVKIYPFAFVFSDKEFPIEGVQDWNKYFKLPVDEDVEINFNPVMPIDDDFPERYIFTGMQLLGRSGVESVIAWPR